MNNALDILIQAHHTVDIPLIKNLLSRSKARLTITNSLAETRNYIKNKSFDVVLLDFDQVTSEEINEFMALNNLVYNTPIILMSNNSVNNELTKQTLNAGAQDWLIKKDLDDARLSRSIHHSILRKQIENTLREESALIKHADVAIISLNPDSVITGWNDSAEEMFGYSAGEAIGQPITLIAPIDEKDEIPRILEMVKNGIKISQYETTRVTKAGNKITTLLNASPVINKASKIIGASIIASDITQRKLLEQQISIQYKVATAFTEAMNLNNAAYSVLKLICANLNWQLGEIWAIDPSKNTIQNVANILNTNMPKEFERENRQFRFHKGEGISGYIWETKQPFWVEDLSNHYLLVRKDIIKKAGLKSCFGFPITFQQEVLGVMLFYSDMVRQPEQSTLTMFVSIGNQIGTFIKRKRAQGDLLYLAQHDVLTGLANRVVFEDNLHAAMNNAHRHHCMIAVLYIDIDHFSKFYDLLGPEHSDTLLKEMGKRLRYAIREMDTVARFGGDEFFIFLADMTSKENIEHVTQKILTIIASPFLIDEKEYYLTASIGVSLFPTNGKDIETLLKNADIALYSAKQHGGNHYEFCPKNASMLSEQRVLLESKLSHAIEKNELRLHYQPIISAKTGKIVGSEALIRWYHNNKIISPADFIPIVEETNLVSPIGEWVIRTACAQTKKWQDQGLIPLYTSVNVSPNQLDRNFVSMVSQILKETGLEARYLAIEITETCFMHETEINLYLLRALKELGLSIYIDDFGTGYSSLGYLKNFAVDCLKIDRSFITHVKDNANSAAIVSAIIAMAHSLNMQTIAEGIENEDHLDFLKEKGCDKYQGYYFSKPLPADEMLALLKTDFSKINS